MEADDEDLRRLNETIAVCENAIEVAEQGIRDAKKFRIHALWAVPISLVVISLIVQYFFVFLGGFLLIASPFVAFFIIRTIFKESSNLIGLHLKEKENRSEQIDRERRHYTEWKNRGRK